MYAEWIKNLILDKRVDPKLRLCLFCHNIELKRIIEEDSIISQCPNCGKIFILKG